MKTYITQHHKTIINKYYSVSCDTKKTKPTTISSHWS